MLVLSRKPSETIVIGDRVTVTVLEVRGQRVRIGIEAPPETSIHRGEVHQRMEAEQQAANSERGLTLELSFAEPESDYVV